MKAGLVPLFLLVALASLVGHTAAASSALDQRYALRRIFSAVVNGETEAVHAQAVQAELMRAIRSDPRFEWSDEALDVFIQNRQSAPAGDLGAPKRENLAPWVAFLQGVSEGRADAVLIAEVQTDGRDYYVFQSLLAMPSAEILQSARFVVEDRFALPSFVDAARSGWKEIVRALPFDATVLSREDYRVVIDRGAPLLRPGMFLPTFTLESGGNGIYLVETGRVQLTRVEPKMAFGKVAVERKPLEVAAGNKVRLVPIGESGMLVESEPTHPMKTALASPGSAAGGVPSRSIASETIADTAFRKGSLGHIDVDFAGTFLTWNQTTAAGVFASQSAFYPGAMVRTEFRVTRQTFVDLGLNFGMASLTTPTLSPAVSLNSQMNQIRGQVGYRLGLTGQQAGPTVEVRAGYSRTQFQVDASPDPLAPSGMTYGGIALGGGVKFPLSAKYLLALDLNSLLFGGLSESSGTSGQSSSGISGWDFAFKAAYNYTPNLNITGKLAFQTNSAGFTGTGTRAVSLSSTSQNSRAVLVGISYFY